MASRKKIVSVEKLTFSHSIKKTHHQLFQDFDLTIYANEIVTILGPSGSGKSTLASILAGHQQAQAGTITIDGIQHASPGRYCIVIHQAHDIFEWLTVKENMKLVCSDPSVISKHLRMVGLEDFEDHRGNQLSGGMKKRLSFARALCINPHFIILDEAFSSLDYQLRHSLYQELLSVTRKEKKTLLLITHDIEEAAYLSDRIIIIGGHPTSIKHEIDVRRLRQQHTGTFADSKSFHELLATLRKGLGI